MEHLVIEFAIVYFFWHSYLIPAIVLGVIIVFNVVAGPITDVLRFGKQKQYGAAAPPPEVRRYLMKSGLEEIRDQNLPPAMQAKIGCELLVAACDDVFSGMATDLMSEGMEHLGSIPLEHCARCKAPVFTHEATQIEGRYYCGTCVKTKIATVPKPEVGGI